MDRIIFDLSTRLPEFLPDNDSSYTNENSPLSRTFLTGEGILEASGIEVEVDIEPIPVSSVCPTEGTLASAYFNLGEVPPEQAHQLPAVLRIIAEGRSQAQALGVPYDAGYRLREM